MHGEVVPLPGYPWLCDGSVVLPMNDDSTSTVSLTGAVAIGIGGMVGGGIFAVLGVAAEQAGGATPLAFAIAGVVAALTAYSYTKLSLGYPSGGGTVHFIDQVFGRDPVTGTVNVVLWAGYIATTGLYAAAFGNYGASLLPGDAESSAAVFKSLAVVGVAVPWWINLSNAGLIARTEGIVVAIKMSILLLVVAAGVPSVDSGRLGADTWSSPASIIAAGMLVFVAYEGFELISNASADMVRPRRNLPLAYGLSVGIVVVLYIAISAVVVGSLAPAEIEAAADFALAEAASASLGQIGFTLVGMSALLATFSALATISGLSSLIFLMVFAFVNVAAMRADSDVRVNRWTSGLGALLATASFALLFVQSLTDDVVAVIVFGVLVAGALTAEHTLFRRRRSARVAAATTPRRERPVSDYLRNLLVVLSARTLPPVWHVGQ